MIRRYETEVAQPSIEVLRKLAVALSSPADALLFEEDERGPDDDLRIPFETASAFPADEKRLARELIEGLALSAR